MTVPLFLPKSKAAPNFYVHVSKLNLILPYLKPKTEIVISRKSFGQAQCHLSTPVIFCAESPSPLKSVG